MGLRPNGSDHPNLIPERAVPKWVGYPGSGHRRPPPLPDFPERSLWIAVIYQSVKDAEFCAPKPEPPSSGSRRYYTKKTLYEWRVAMLAAKDAREFLVSDWCAEVCDWVGLEHSALLRALKQRSGWYDG